MPNYEIACPPGSYNIKIKKGSVEVPVDWTFTRSGEDGDEIIIPLFGGDEFVGEVLEGLWQKGDDGSIQGPFTAKISSGELQLTGKSDAAGTWRAGWISSKSKIPFLDDLVIDVHLKLPSHSSADTFLFALYLSDDNDGDPDSDSNWLLSYIYTDTTTYKILLRKKVNGTTTDLLSLTNVTNAEGTFRFKFEENKSGHNHTHIYYHDGTGSVDESTDEVTGSPFSLDLAIDSAYPHLSFRTNETTNRTVSSDFVRVTYPDDIQVRYDLDDDDVNKGDVKVWDTMGYDSDETQWRRVLSKDPYYDFVGDCVVENGLIRLWIDEGVGDGFKLYYWDGSSWIQGCYYFPYEVTSNKSLTYPFLKNIVSITSDAVQVNVRFEDSSTQNSDYYLDCTVILNRGQYYVEITSLSSYPSQRVQHKLMESVALRWGYTGDAENTGIADDDLNLDSYNTTLSDNFMIVFDDANNAYILGFASNEKPTIGIMRIS